MKLNEQIETLIKALGDAQNDADIWRSAYDACMERCKKLGDEVKKLTDELDEVKPSARFAGGDTDE